MKPHATPVALPARLGGWLGLGFRVKGLGYGTGNNVEITVEGLGFGKRTRHANDSSAGRPLGAT